MKKLWSVPLLLALILSLCACGGSPKETRPAPSDTGAETTAPAETDAEPTEPAGPDEPFCAGFGRADITPWESTPLAGYGNNDKRLSVNVLDPLNADCVALRDGNGETVLLFMIDILYIMDDLVDYCRQHISEVTGIAGDHIYLAVSHSHSAPDVNLTSSYAIARYRSYLRQRLGEAAAAAIGDLKPATASTGSAEIEGLNFVRHYKLTNGTYAGDNFGDFSSAPIEGYETEADHTLRMLRFEREGAKDILLMNFQVHPHRTGGISNPDVSSDVIARIRDYVEAREDVYCSYMQGGAGNINPTSRIAADMATSDYKEYGVLFGKTALAALPSMTPVELGPIKISGSVPHTTTVNHTQANLSVKAAEIWSVFTSTGDRAKCIEMGKPYGIHSCYHASAIIYKNSLPDTLDIELDALSFGDVGLVTAPYEMFDVSADYIRDNSPYAFTLVMAYCNGYYSYIPATASFDNTCYEADQCRFIQGTAEELADALVGMLKELHEQPEPTEKVVVTAPEQENPFAGLTCDGRIYYNYAYSYYQGDKTRPRKETPSGTVFPMTLLNQDGQLETFEIPAKKIALQIDSMSVVCLWKNKDGRIAAASSPEKLGLSITWNNYVTGIDGKSVKLNSSSADNGRARTLTVTDTTKYALAPEDPLATALTKKATQPVLKDKVTLVEDDKGQLKALFIVQREGMEGDTENLALKAKLSFTFPIILSNKYQPELMHNGNEAAGLTDCAGFYFRENCEFVFELEREATVTGYKLVNMSDPETFGGVKDYEIYTSLDGMSWTKLDAGTGMSKGFRENRFEEGTAARFVKLLVTDAHCNTKLDDNYPEKRVVRIAEFEIFGH